jgi:hypothetical protein
MAATVAKRTRNMSVYTQQRAMKTHISLNLVFALGSTTNSGGVKVVQLWVVESAEQL